jgi:hypothetical protein
MGDVYANGLEISGKGSDGKTIAAFPDVCFTPPENPATPPGVPIPYPSFGMSSDTENGTGTVFISGKTVNIKNKSDLSRTSGTEAGCAAKKGIITSKNMGKEYYHTWSPDVKFEGEPVIRFTDLATNNHASPQANTPPWLHVLKLKIGRQTCAKILADVGIVVHPYKDADEHCEKRDKSKPAAKDNKYQQSDHIIQNACFENSRGGGGISTFEDYNMRNAPCVCLQDGTRRGTEHGEKTAAQNDWTKDQLDAGKNPTYEEVREANLDAMKKAKAPALDDKKGEEHPAIECLRMICDAYFHELMDDEGNDDTQTRTPRGGKFKADRKKGTKKPG